MGGALALGAIACSSGDSDGEAPAPSVATGTPPAAAKVALDSGYGSGGIATLPLTASGGNRFMAVTVAPDGKTYAAGFVSDSGDQSMAVARLDAKGALDKTFGKDGVATVNAAIGGKTAELARAVVVQSSGKIVIAGPVEHDPTAEGDAARDTDIALARFDATGKIDTSFGKSGVAIIDVGTGRATSATAFVGDNSWGLGTLAGDKLVVWGSKLTDVEGRNDNDYVMLGLTDAGALDSGFGTGGKLVLDVGGSTDNPRNLLVQSDGKVVATGYSNVEGVVQPVLVRVDSKGVLDKAFGKDGVATQKVLAGVTESYNVSMQGSDYILAGYGRGADSTEKVDLVVYRFKANGTFDSGFGTSGVTRVDIAKEDDRARNVIVLPDGRVMAVGSGKKNATNIDGMMVLMSKDGALDTSFGDGGILISDLGGPADAWYGVALSSDKKSLIVVGYKGVDATSGGTDAAVAARVLL
jgi:uncharacterized delta-60 repeat protein